MSELGGENGTEILTERDHSWVRPSHLVGWFVVAIALFFSGAALGASGDSADAAADGVYFGAWAQPRGGENNIEAVQRLEADLGSKLPLIRSFDFWDTNLDNNFTNWVVDGGRRLHISVTPKRVNGERVNWSTIANAQPGSRVHNEMVAMARRVKALDGEVWMTFHHEPEAKDRIVYGNNTDFKNAWKALHRVFEQQGADPIWVWTMTSWSFEVNTNDRRSAGKWYPGNAFVDYLGADPYNWNKCRGNDGERWTELERIIAPFMEFAKQYPDKQLVLPEFASAEGSPGQKAQWLDNARNYLKRPDVAARFAGVVYFHDVHPGEPRCNWWLDSSTATLNAARKFASDSFFDRNIGNPQPPDDDPTPRRCRVRPTPDGDRIFWAGFETGSWSFNVRRNDKWIGGVSSPRKTIVNWGVSGGVYKLIARNNGNTVTLNCPRL